LLHRNYPASSLLRASPPPHTARPDPRGLPVLLSRGDRWGFPCCGRFPLPCMPTPIPRWDPRNLVALSSLGLRPYPVFQAGRLPHCPFRGLLSVYSCFGLHVRQVAQRRPSTPEAPMASSPPPPLRLLPAGATSCRVGFAPTENRRLFTAH